MSVPREFTRPRILRFAYQAGYRNGYDGKPNRADLRGKDAAPAYEAGYAKGVESAAKRKENAT